MNRRSAARSAGAAGEECAAASYDSARAARHARRDARGRPRARARRPRAVIVVATPDPYQGRASLELARKANPSIRTLVRSHTDAEREYLERHGAEPALVGEHELALSLAHHALVRMGCEEDAADATVARMRRRSPVSDGDASGG